MEGDGQKRARGVLVARDVEGTEVLGVGGGAGASRKAARLLEAGARVHVVSLDPIAARMSELRERHGDVSVRVDERAFAREDLEGKALVFAATDDAVVNGEVVRLARARGVFANSATIEPEDEAADFSLLARVAHGGDGLEVGVHTAGGAPALSVAFSRRLVRLLDDEEPAWGKMAPVLACLRDAVKPRGTLSTRRAFWHTLIEALLARHSEGWETDRVLLAQVISAAANAHEIKLTQEEVDAALEASGMF